VGVGVLSDLGEVFGFKLLEVDVRDKFFCVGAGFEEENFLRGRGVGVLFFCYGWGGYDGVGFFFGVGGNG
jgi:hypothetical protein